MRTWVRNTPAAIYLLVVLAFIYLPVVVLVLFSFQDGPLPVPPFNGPSLHWYEKMFGNERLIASLINSVVVEFYRQLLPHSSVFLQLMEWHAARHGLLVAFVLV